MSFLRLVTGTVLLSLVATVVLGDFFHAEKAVLIQENHHASHHENVADFAHVNKLLNAETSDEDCHPDSTELDAINPLQQRFLEIDMGCSVTMSFHSAFELSYIPILHNRIRSVPLFEDASLFAATISMRV